MKRTSTLPPEAPESSPRYHVERATLLDYVAEEVVVGHGCVDVMVDALTVAELAEWAGKPLDLAAREDMERIVWAMGWREPEKARERCAAALWMVGEGSFSSRVRSAEIDVRRHAMQSASYCLGGSWLNGPQGPAGRRLAHVGDPALMIQTRIVLAWLRVLAALEGVAMEES